MFSLRALTFISLILYFLVISFIVTWLLSRSQFIRRVFKISGFVFLLLFAVSSLTGVSKILSMGKNVEAVVLTQEVNVRSAPREDSTEIFIIHAGLKVRISDTRGDWYEIRLADGNEGWLSVKDVEII